MSQAVISIIMGSTALLALALLVRAVGRARAAGDLDVSTAFAIAVGWLISLPIAVAVTSGSVTRRLNPFRELETVPPDWYTSAAHGSTALLAAIATGVALRQLTSHAVRLHTAGLLAMVLWMVAHLAAGLQGSRMLSLSGVALLVCLVAATVLPRGRGASVGAGIFGVTVAIASGAAAIFRYDLTFAPCRDECVLGPALTGVLGNENLLGTVLVAAIPFAYLGFRGRAATWLGVYLAAMAAATGSRGAIVTAVIAVVVMLLVRPRLDANRQSPARLVVAGLFLLAGLLASVSIVLRDWDGISLTGRPDLWRVASEYVARSPLFGYGPGRWEMLYSETGEIPRAAQHSAHNQWMEVLFIAGWVGAVLLLAMVIAMVVSSRSARPAVMVTVATVFMIGATERAWSIATVDFVSFSLIAAILMGPTAIRSGGWSSPASRARPETLGGACGGVDMPAQQSPRETTVSDQRL